MEKLKGYMSKVFRVPVEDIFDTATMDDIVGWDSLTHIELIIVIENEYGIQLSGDDIADMQSVREIQRILKKKNIF